MSSPKITPPAPLTRLPNGAIVIASATAVSPPFTNTYVLASWDPAGHAEFITWLLVGGNCELGHYHDSLETAADDYAKRLAPLENRILPTTSFRRARGRGGLRLLGS